MPSRSSLHKVPTTIQSTELRNNLAHYLRASKREPVVVSTDRGADARVLVDATLYNKLVEQYQDAVDTRELERLVESDSGAYTSLEEL